MSRLFIRLKASAHVSSMFSTPGFCRPASRSRKAAMVHSFQSLGSSAEQDSPFLGCDDPFPPGDDRLPLASAELCDLYTTQRHRLLRFFHRKGSGDESSDLVHEAFARLAASPTTQTLRPGAYLTKIATNLVIDRTRRAQRRKHIFVVSVDELHLSGPDEIQRLEARDMLRRLERAMLRLRPKTREIFLAHRLDGYSYTEIAARTGLSVKGVEKQMSKAIAQLDRWVSDRG